MGWEGDYVYVVLVLFFLMFVIDFCEFDFIKSYFRELNVFVYCFIL